MKTANRLVAAFLLGGLASSCTTISPYSQVAFEQATAVKAEALVVMDKATEDYSLHQKEVDALKLDMDKAYEYSKGRIKNEITTAQWDILRSPDRNLLGGFLKRWQTNCTDATPTACTLGHGFVVEEKKLVSDGFDTIIALESGKIKPEQVTSK